MQEGFRVAVLGGGSLGLTFAAHFICAGFATRLITRSAQAKALGTDGFSVEGCLGEMTFTPDRFAVTDSGSLAGADLDADLLVVATKAYQAVEALQELYGPAPGGLRPVAVLLLQNGWGAAEEVRAVLPPDVALYSAAVMTGTERRSPTLVRINAAAAPARMGSLFTADLQPLAPLVEGGEGLLPISIDPDVKRAMLDKLLFNCCMNVTGALTGHAYGELMTRPALQALLIAIAGETIEAIHADQGYRPATGGAAYFHDWLTPVIMPRGVLHRSSMLQDLEQGRPTEIAYLNGAVVAMARRHGVPVPVNETLVALMDRK